MKTTMNNKKLKKMHFSKKNNLRIYLIKKNRYLKKIENELLKTKLELQNQQKAYKLLILNMFLGFVIIFLIYLNFYKPALIGFVYLLIQNNSFIKETFYVYLIQKHRFNKYYKKKFPVFFYGLPIVGIGSLIGVLYSLSLIDTTFQEMVYQVNMSWYKEYQLEKLTTQLYGFALVFFHVF